MEKIRIQNLVEGDKMIWVVLTIVAGGIIPPMAFDSEDTVDKFLEYTKERFPDRLMDIKAFEVIMQDNEHLELQIKMFNEAIKFIDKMRDNDPCDCPDCVERRRNESSSSRPKTQA